MSGQNVKIMVFDQISLKMQTMLRNKLGSDFEIVFCENDANRETHISTADALITFTRGISKDLIEKADKCKIIQKLGAGVNNIEVDAASKKGIPVCNTQGQNARAVAEHAVMLMLAVYKQLIKAHNGIVREGNWLKTNLRDHSYQLSHKKVGLIGLGHIGKEVSQILQGFQCDMRYFDVYRLPKEQETDFNVSFMELDQLLRSCDIISLHAPLTDQTYRLIDENKLLLMQVNSILINTSRGGLIDEKMLYLFLKEKKLLGAGLDVFEEEPIDLKHPLKTLDNVVLTPHIGGGTVEAMENVIEQACRNINQFLLFRSFYDKGDVVNLTSF